MTEPWIETVGGRHVWLNRPDRYRNEHLWELCHALAHICRFTGHVTRFYSVAHHLLLCEQISRRLFIDDTDLHLAVLLHDVHEGYLGDVSAPLKLLLPDYSALEESWIAVIQRAHGVSKLASIPAEVRHVDQLALMLEGRSLGFSTDDWLTSDLEPRGAGATHEFETNRVRCYDLKLPSDPISETGWELLRRINLCAEEGKRHV